MAAPPLQLASLKHAALLPARPWKPCSRPRLNPLCRVPLPDFRALSMVYGGMGLRYMYPCITMGRSLGPLVPSISSTAHTLSSPSRPNSPPAVLACTAHGRYAFAPAHSIWSSGTTNGGKKQPASLAQILGALDVRPSHPRSCSGFPLFASVSMSKRTRLGQQWCRVPSVQATRFPHIRRAQDHFGMRVVFLALLTPMVAAPHRAELLTVVHRYGLASGRSCLHHLRQLASPAALYATILYCCRS
jgi:hypothetical protein